MFYHNFINLCNKRGISPSAAAEEMGYQRSVVTRWSKGTAPRQATVQRVADFFGVSVAELTEDAENEKKPALISEDELSATQIEAINFVLGLSNDQLIRFVKMGQAAFEEDDK